MHPKYTIVAARANRACEYCNAPEVISNFAFEARSNPIAKINPYTGSLREVLEGQLKQERIQREIEGQSRLEAELAH
jgi:hypothetical protein